MFIKSNIEIIILFLIAAVSSYIAIWVILKTPLIKMFTDKPGLRKVHQRVIPRIGGIGILICFQAFLYIWHFAFPSLPHLPENLLSALMFASFAIMLVGLVDDMVIFHIHNKAKFILEILIATEIVFLNGIQLTEIHFLNWDLVLADWMSIPITILWIVGVTNAINIIDGVDGLAGSIMVVIFTTIAILTGFNGDTGIFILCVMLAGLVAGFLSHNVSPARVFLGDTGSLFLGITTGVLSIYLVSSSHSSYPLVIAPLMVGLPVLDVFVAMIRRFIIKLLGGVHWFRALGAMSVADNEHMHHRLIYRGLTHTETVIILVLFHAVICMGAIVVKFADNTQSVIVLGYISVLVLWFIYKLDFLYQLGSIFGNGTSSITLRFYNVAVVNGSDILNHSLIKYRQPLLSFTFLSIQDVLDETSRFSAFILEKLPGMSDEETVSLVNAIYAQYACPIVLISDTTVAFPKHLSSQMNDHTFLLLKRPIYIPVLCREITRLIRQARGWSMERVTEDTRQFFLQAIHNEKV